MDTRKYVNRMAHMEHLRIVRRGTAVYYLKVLESGDVVYVGQTHDPMKRSRDHKCGRKGLKLQVVCVVETVEEAVRVEKALVALQERRGARLTNKTFGGKVPGCDFEFTNGTPLHHKGIAPAPITKMETKEEIKARRKYIRSVIDSALQRNRDLEK